MMLSSTPHAPNSAMFWKVRDALLAGMYGSIFCASRLAGT